MEVFSDEFVNGKRVTQLPTGAALLYTNDNIVFELQQFSISSGTYISYKTLKDLVDDNGAFIAPLPAALLVNSYNVSMSEEFVLGRFTAASNTIISKFVERVFTGESPLEQRIINSPEENEVPAPLVTMAPCYEGRYRTAITPNGWLENSGK